jgi:trimethylamine:corrinoid methyltransferase-like protein
MKRLLRILLALSVVTSFLLLVGSDGNVTPVRNIILLAAYCASGCALFNLISKGKHA